MFARLYADIAMACALQCLSPVAQDVIKMPHALRKRFADDKLAPEYGDLLEWRDGIFKEHYSPAQ